MDLRLRIAQIDTTLGDLQRNLETHLREVRSARAAGAQMIVFPELSLSGYFLKDLVPEVALAPDAALLRPLLEESRSITIGFGLVERARDGRLYNSFVFFEDGRLAHLHRKVHLVSYGIFEESRDFAAGEQFSAFSSKHGRIGVLICEDMWHIDGAYLYYLDGVDVLLVPSASPARGVAAAESGFASLRAWRSLQEAFALLFRTWLVYVGRVGFEDGVAFPGQSRVLDPWGALLAELPLFDAGSLDVVLGTQELQRARATTPLRRDERELNFARELYRRVGFPGPADTGPLSCGS